MYRIELHTPVEAYKEVGTMQTPKSNVRFEVEAVAFFILGIVRGNPLVETLDSVI